MPEGLPSLSPYMGGPVSVTTGRKGEVANARLIAHGEALGRKLHRVTDRVYCQLGSSLGNSTMVLGQDGMIVIDTGDCVQQSVEQREDFRSVTDRAVSALIYTHGHYALGSRTYVAPGDEERLPIYAHRDLLQVMSRTLGDLAPFLTRRVAMQFGMFLPPSGPDAMPNQGLGAEFFPLDRYTPTPGFVRPNRLLDDGQCETIDGLRFQFWHTPADSDDTVLIWMPDEGVVVNNIAWPAMFNIYTLRGEAFRNPTRLLPGLDRILALDPEHLVGVHGVPISGKEAIRQAVTEYRDCIQYTYDQTVRGINQGLTPDELVRFVQLPAALANGRLTGQFYGELPFYVRQIYCGLVGWFGSDTVELHRLPENDAARRWVDLAGGAGRVLQQAREALEKREFQWAAELSTTALRAGADVAAARQIKADALRAMAQVTTAANTRSWYLAQARELEEKVDTHQLPFTFVNASTVRQMPPGTYVNAMRFKLDPSLSAERPRCVHLAIDQHHFTLLLRHGVVQVLPGCVDEADATVGLTMDQWAALVSGDAAQANAPASEARFGGDETLGRALLDAWR
ncbi:alkyl sulfatase BDS1-like metallo-beta-lactamase superfamily hydrolase [Paraburkholderia sp. GAS199]|uniref:alkyl sulfatase dimerization domain-containing protein n=1 Tax=Paraburkholderia sp. GAS199 TaxID=3035126 RepID=UPI003D1EBB28